MKKKLTLLSLTALLVLIAAACGQTPKQQDIPPDQSGESVDLVTELGLTAEAKDASSYTVEINSALYSLLDFEDTSEYENATRGLIDAPEVLELTDGSGNVIWSQEAYAFLEDYEKVPDTVNPSLWENTRNNHAYGLFEVTEGIYQVRGYDMANLTVIEGDTGWIVFDPLMSVECTQAAMQLVEKNLGQRPVKAVIISHSHVDHYGGIKGIMTNDDAADKNLSIEQQLASGKIPIIVPEGFTEHAVAENVYAGKAMARRANYQYGVLLEAGVTGKLAMGIGTNLTVLCMLYGCMMGNYDGLYLPMMVLGYVFAVPFFILTVRTSQKHGQKKSLMTYVGVALACYVGVLALLCLWNPGNPAFNLSIMGESGLSINLYTVLFILFFGLGYGAYYATADMPIPMVADCADYETYRSGKFIPGIIGTLFSLVDKLVSSLAATVVSIVLMIMCGIDYLPTKNTPYVEGMNWATIFLFCGIPMIAWALTLWAMKGYELDGKRVKTVNAVNAARKEAISNGMSLEQAMAAITDDTVSIE